MTTKSIDNSKLKEMPKPNGMHKFKVYSNVPMKDHSVNNEMVKESMSKTAYKRFFVKPREHSEDQVKESHSIIN